MPRLTRSLSLAFTFALLVAASARLAAQVAAPVTAKDSPKVARVGAYLMSLYDLNPANNTFTADFWLWFVHQKSVDINPLKSIEPENARDFRPSLETTEDHGAERYHAEKVRGVFNYGWNVANFPFDRHTLQIRLSEGQDESIVYVADSGNTGVDREVSAEGWHIEKVTMTTGTRHFDSNFGEPGESGGSTYAQAVVSVTIARMALGLFWKLHAPVYIALLIGLVSFFMDTSKDGIFNGRISLLVGMIFAVVVNTQRVAATLGQSPAFTLPDKIHIVTLMALLCGIVGAMISRRLHVTNRGDYAVRLDRRMAAGVLVVYVAINVVMITRAAHGG
jgi:hypothetical protein